MTNKQNTHFSFAVHAVIMRRKKHSFLDDVNSLINWQPISTAGVALGLIIQEGSHEHLLSWSMKYNEESSESAFIG